MSDTDRAYARRTDPDTSQDAADSIGDVTRLEAIVEDAVLGCGYRGATWDELHDITGLPMQSISPRFKPLAGKFRIGKKIGPDGKVVTRPGKSGRAQIVWFHSSTRAW